MIMLKFSIIQSPHQDYYYSRHRFRARHMKSNFEENSSGIDQQDQVLQKVDEFIELTVENIFLSKKSKKRSKTKLWNCVRNFENLI